MSLGETMEEEVEVASCEILQLCQCLRTSANAIAYRAQEGCDAKADDTLFTNYVIFAGLHSRNDEGVQHAGQVGICLQIAGHILKRALHKVQALGMNASLTIELLFLLFGGEDLFWFSRSFVRR